MLNVTIVLYVSISFLQLYRKVQQSALSYTEGHCFKPIPCGKRFIQWDHTGDKWLCISMQCHRLELSIGGKKHILLAKDSDER